MEKTLNATGNLVSGVADVRYTPLDQLARKAEGSVGDSLQHVLPADAGNRVTISAFGSAL